MKLTAGILAFLFAALPALAAEIKLEPAQQEAVNKLKAKGGLVMQLAADSDALVVGLSQAGKQANDEDLALVKTLPKVVELNLAGTAVTDGGLANIGGLNTLTVLHLENTGVTDAGLPHLKGLANLTYLNLYNTSVTDAGVAHLKDLKKLKNLYLWQTKVTDAGAKELKAAIAGIHVNRGEELAKVVIPPPAEKKDEKKDEKKPAVAAAKPINLKCPVSGKDVDAQFTLAHEGKVIGFCCNNCPKAFEKEPAKFAANIKADAPKEEPKKTEPKKEEKKPEPKPAVAAKPINLKCPVSGDEVDAQFTLAHEGKTVAFCCGDCRSEFEKNPAKFASKIKADAPAAKEEKKDDKKPAAVSLVNTKCPRTGNPAVATLTAEHEGKTLGFCSAECQTKFKANPAKYLPRLVQDGPGAKK